MKPKTTTTNTVQANPNAFIVKSYPKRIDRLSMRGTITRVRQITGLNHMELTHVLPEHATEASFWRFATHLRKE
jgi:hypothetical protein